MVCRDYDECFVRVLKIEIVSDLDSLVELVNFSHSGACIVSVKCVVDVSAFNHHKEFIRRFFKHIVEASLCHLSDGKHTGDRIHSEAYIAVVEWFRLNEDNFVCRFFINLSEFVKTVNDFNIVFSVFVFDVSRVALAVLHAFKVRTSEEINFAVNELVINVVGHFSAWNVCVESTGSGIVAEDSCYYTNAVTVIFQNVCHRVNRDAVRCYAKHTVYSLMPGR